MMSREGSSQLVATESCTMRLLATVVHLKETGCGGHSLGHLTATLPIQSIIRYIYKLQYTLLYTA